MLQFQGKGKIQSLHGAILRMKSRKKTCGDSVGVGVGGRMDMIIVALIPPQFKLDCPLWVHLWTQLQTQQATLWRTLRVGRLQGQLEGAVRASECVRLCCQLMVLAVTLLWLIIKSLSMNVKENRTYVVISSGWMMLELWKLPRVLAKMFSLGLAN
jgi:hypothetical protein